MNAVVKPLESNLWDHLAFVAQSRKDTVIKSEADILVIDNGLECETLNRIGRSGIHPKFGAARAEAVTEAFTKKSPPLPFTWTLGPLSGQGTMDDTLTSLGLVKTADLIGMAAPMKTMGLPSNSSKVSMSNV